MNLFSRQLQLQKAMPDKLLFEAGDSQLNASQLTKRAALVAALLVSRGVQSGRCVAILVPRGMDAVVAIYAVLYAGGVYVPIDFTSPKERARYIIQDAQCHSVIGAGPCPEWINEAGIAYIDMLLANDEAVEVTAAYANDPEQIATILYTSGSTGSPKGVAISHRAILAFADWGQQTFSLSSQDRIASLAPFHFDLSLFDLFVAPGVGATTYFIPDRLTMAPAKLVAWLHQHRITTWYTVPSILQFIALKGGLDKIDLSALRQILFAGEVFATPQLKALTCLLPKTVFYNLFGPTETNVCLYWPVDKRRLGSGQSIPIGASACEAEIKIDPENSELFVKSPCLMSGYWENGHCELPLDKEGWFHTGDSVSPGAQGEYQYHGRLDRMIKRSGYRIEPAEIEQVLNTAKNVALTAVVALPDKVSGNQVIALIAGNDVDPNALRRLASEKLPSYMRPSHYYFVDEMPLLANGKIDFQRITQLIEQEFSS
jgi:amino acid adenylation domain-containing protein